MVVLSKYRTTPSAASANNVGGRCRFVSCFISDSVALSAVQGSCGPEHPDSGFKLPLSATQRPGKLIQKTEENMLPRIPRQQPIHDLSSRRENLRRNIHHRRPKRAEVHPQQPPLFFLMHLLPTARLRQHQRRPGFQAPGQRRHHHVRPIREQAIDRRGQRANPALELRQQVLLVAAVVRVEHNFFGRLRLVVA